MASKMGMCPGATSASSRARSATSSADSRVLQGEEISPPNARAQKSRSRCTAACRAPRPSVPCVSNKTCSGRNSFNWDVATSAAVSRSFLQCGKAVPDATTVFSREARDNSPKRGRMTSAAAEKSFRAPELGEPSSFVATTSSSSATLSIGHMESVAAAAPAMGPSACSTMTGDLAADIAKRNRFAGGTAARPGPATATRACSTGFRTSAPRSCSAQAAANRTRSGSGKRCNKDVRSLDVASETKMLPSTMTMRISAATWPSATCRPCSSHRASASAMDRASRPWREAARSASRKVPGASDVPAALVCLETMDFMGSAMARQSRATDRTAGRRVRSTSSGCRLILAVAKEASRLVRSSLASATSSPGASPAGPRAAASTA
mmetsp:Transcript_38443/g.114829  ORF Transcript_38443/g.114829 Transcript_38443/m.114829 type:complete len:380 (-) Transcript_38443:243-1382(-)